MLTPVLNTPAAFLEAEVGGRSKAELIMAIEVLGMGVSPRAEDLMSHPSWQPGVRERVRFGCSTAEALGFSSIPRNWRVWERILELGHSYCSPAAGPTLSSPLLTALPRGGSYWFIMNQIVSKEGRPSVFVIQRDANGSRWLRAGCVRPQDWCPLDRLLVYQIGQ